MDTPTYSATITIGGSEQTTFFTGSFPPPRETDSGIITRQSGKVILTLVDAAGVAFDATSLTSTNVYVVPYNSGTAKVLIGTGVISGAGNNIFTVEWDIDSIPDSWSQFPQDDLGAIVMTFVLEETGVDDYYQFATRFNVFDADLAGDESTLPLTGQTFNWDSAIASEWVKYERGTPTTLIEAVNYLSAAGKNDWGTVIDKDLTTAPAGVDNAQYIIAGIGGAWSTGTIGDIARYSLADTTWYFKTPTDGNIVFVADENLTYGYDGAAWTDQQVVHTGEVTGGTALVIDKTAITNQSLVTAASGDYILATDASDSDNLVKIDVADFNGNMNTSTYDASAIAEQLVGLVATQSMTNKTVNGVVLSNVGSSSQYLAADGTYNTPAGAGDMDTATYDAATVAEQLVGLTAVQILTNKDINGVILNSTGLPTAFLNATGSYTTPAGGGDMSTLTYDAASVSEQLIGLTASQNMTNKSVNGVTPVSGGSSSQYLSADGTYNTPAGAGDMLKAAYDAANINEQLVGLTATQSLTNKTINTVVLNGAGSAGLFLNQAGDYVTPAGGGDMTAAVYDSAAVSEQLVGLTATQSLTNKTINTVVLNGAGSSTVFLNQAGGYSTPAVGGAVDTVASSDGSITVTGTTSIDLAVTNKDVPNDQTGTTYTPVLTDAGKTIWLENAAATTLTIPTNASVAYPVNTTILVMQEGAGVVTVTGDTGVTVNGVSAGSGAINNRYQGATLVKRATDEWIISGDIGTVS